MHSLLEDTQITDENRFLSVQLENELQAQTLNICSMHSKRKTTILLL